jgi:plasmid stabilization system protein ParE
MKYIVSLSRRAEQDRERAFEWYRLNYSEAFAVRWFNGITRAMRSLAQNPERCHKAIENDRYPFELHELLYGKRKTKHRVLYTIHNDIVLVLHIRHSSQGELTDDDL